MMEALGQLAKDGNLLAPTHKHIGVNLRLPHFLFMSYIKYTHNGTFFNYSYFNFCHCKVSPTTKKLWRKVLRDSCQQSISSRLDKLNKFRTNENGNRAWNSKYIFKVGQSWQVQNQWEWQQSMKFPRWTSDGLGSRCVFGRWDVKGNELLLNFCFKSINCYSEASSSLLQESYTQYTYWFQVSWPSAHVSSHLVGPT